MRLTIPGTLPGLNAIVDDAKKHWSAYARGKKSHTRNIALLAKIRKVPAVEGPACLHCTWYAPNRRQDPDNLAAAVKYILDGLVEAGVLPNDGWHQVVEIRHRFFIDTKTPRIEVELEPVA